MAHRRRFPDGGEPSVLRVERVADAGGTSPGRRPRPTLGGGRVTPHTSLRALLFFAFGIFLTSTWLVTLLPAARLRDVPGVPGAPALAPQATRGRALSLAEGAGH